jgi:hypothetical protein
MLLSPPVTGIGIWFTNDPTGTDRIALTVVAALLAPIFGVVFLAARMGNEKGTTRAASDDADFGRLRESGCAISEASHVSSVLRVAVAEVGYAKMGERVRDHLDSGVHQRKSDGRRRERRWRERSW